MIAFVLLAFTAFPLENVRVVDADTVDADIQFPLGIRVMNQRIRCADFDAWEKSKVRQFDGVPATDEEIRKGKIATQELIELLKDHRLEYEPGPKKERDSFGRVLGVLWLIDQDGNRQRLAEWMKQRGHVRE